MTPAEIESAAWRLHDAERTRRQIGHLSLAYPEMTIADNAANGGIVTGGKPVKPDEVDLLWASALCYRNSEIEETGVAAGVLNHPGNGIAWLANKLAKYDVRLEAGQIVLAGSFTRPVDAAPGDVFHVDYGELGNVTFRFSRP